MAVRDRSAERTPRNLNRAEGPRLSPTELVRFAWTQLTSMRTALTLLFIAAIAAIPGGLLPQRATEPQRVRDFIRDNPQLGKFYDGIGMFGVYTSVWFSAIYLLLLVSLLGCIVPRIATYAKAMRAEPVRTPANLSRLPEYAAADSDAEPERVLDEAEQRLRAKRFRIRRDTDSVSAERGYLREAGNLVFHVSLVFILFGVALGVLFGYRGSAVVLVGHGFSNNLTQYDDISAGAWFRDRDLRPFTVVVDDFTVRFETGKVATGAPREFRARVDVFDQGASAPRTETIEVNHPLELGGTQVHLLAHGYAPKVSVRDGQGNIAWSGPAVFLPQDGNFTSAGVINAVDARPQRLAFEGFFLPTATIDQRGPRSLFPDAILPQLVLTAWHGPPRTETGIPESVYSLNKAGLTQYTTNGQPMRARMSVGDTIDLPDGTGSITFDGWQRWVKLQISDTPGMGITLASILVAVSGLCLSLFVRPRRLWVRARPGESGTQIEVAGLDQADARTGLADEVADLADALAG